MKMLSPSNSEYPDPALSTQSQTARTRVLFINSALNPGADTAIHLLLLRNLSQDQFELHVAEQPAPPMPAFLDVPGVALRPTNFGPSLWQQTGFQKLAGMAQVLPA